MNILADKYIYKLKELLPQSLNVTLFDPNHGLPKHTSRFDALLVRTVIPINQQTLPEAGNIKFIGTASAGYDHLDLDYLESLGITCASSAGCNANAVAEYVLTVVHKWAESFHCDLTQKKIGVIGCGATGGALVHLLRKLNLPVTCFDPPKEKHTPSFQSASLPELLQCDILSFHTPLTTSGAHPTFHLCNSKWFQAGFNLIINASRGGVVDESSLLAAYAGNKVDAYILDVWENEPVFSDEVANNAFIATPHIAGYSIEAKTKATSQIVDQLLQFWGEEKQVTHQNISSEHKEPLPELSFAEFLWEHHKINYYDRELRKLTGLEPSEKSKRFAKLRSETQLRAEFRTMVKLFPDHSVPEAFRVFKEE